MINERVRDRDRRGKKSHCFCEPVVIGEQPKNDRTNYQTAHACVWLTYLSSHADAGQCPSPFRCTDISFQWSFPSLSLVFIDWSRRRVYKFQDQIEREKGDGERTNLWCLIDSLIQSASGVRFQVSRIIHDRETTTGRPFHGTDTWKRLSIVGTTFIVRLMRRVSWSLNTSERAIETYTHTDRHCGNSSEISSTTACCSPSSFWTPSVSIPITCDIPWHRINTPLCLSWLVWMKNQVSFSLFTVSMIDKQTCCLSLLIELNYQYCSWQFLFSIRVLLSNWNSFPSISLSVEQDLNWHYSPIVD